MRADVGAHVVDHAIPQPQDGPVGTNGELHLVLLLARMIRGQEVLLTVLNPLHRATQPHGQQRDQEVLGVELTAHAETAAHIRLDEVDPVFGKVQQVGQDRAVEVRDLCWTPHRQEAAAGLEVGNQPARLQRHAAVALDHEPFTQHQVRCGKRGIDVTDRHCELGGHVCPNRLVEQRSAGFQRLPAIHNSGQRLVVHRDELGGVLGCVAATRDNHRDRLSDVAHLVAGQRVLQKPLQLLEGRETHRDRLCQRRHIREGHHGGDAGRAARSLGMDACDARMGVRTAHDHGVQHAGEHHIGHVAPATGEQAQILLPLEASANMADRDIPHGLGRLTWLPGARLPGQAGRLCRHQDCSALSGTACGCALLRSVSAAAITAATMFW